MASLTAADAGYLNPAAVDGAAVAAASYTGAQLQASPVSAATPPQGLAADPAGTVTVTRPGASGTMTRSVQFASGDSRNVVEDAIQQLFSSYSARAAVNSKSTVKRGFMNVRLPAFQTLFVAAMLIAGLSLSTGWLSEA